MRIFSQRFSLGKNSGSPRRHGGTKERERSGDRIIGSSGDRKSSTEFLPALAGLIANWVLSITQLPNYPITNSQRLHGKTNVFRYESLRERTRRSPCLRVS